MKPQGYGSAILSFKFEAAHRQPQLGGKCVNLHGHSWSVNVTLFNKTAIGGITEQGVSVEFGAVKACIRRWIDDYLDHATLLGATDPLVRPLLDEGCKLFLFGEQSSDVHDFRHEVADERWYTPIPWPSVEAVAFCLGEKLQQCLSFEIGNYVIIESIMVSETDTNSFAWTSPHSDHLMKMHSLEMVGEPCD